MGRLGDIFTHSELYKAYPVLQDYTAIIQETEPGVQGISFPNRKEIVLNQELFKRHTDAYNKEAASKAAEIKQIESTPEYKAYARFYESEAKDNLPAEQWLIQEKEAETKFFSSEIGKRYYALNWGKSNVQKWEFGWTPQARTVLLHELQHAVQRIEGFSGGSSIRYWNNRLERGYDGRTASQRQKLNDLRAEYNKAKTEDPAFVADMMKLEAMTPNVPRGKVDFDTLTQIEPDPIEWQQYDAAREKLEGQYGDMKVWNFIDLIQDLQKAEAAPGRTASELYLDTAGEIEARDVEARADLTAAERKAKAPDTGNQDTVFADNGTGWMKEEYNPETASIKEQINNSREDLNKMDVVAKVSVPENLKKKDDAAKWAADRLASTGYRIDRKGFGEIYFSKKDIDKGLRYADTPAEKAALAALPQVLKRGIEIGNHVEHKGRPKQTITFAAPVELNGIRGNMGVVVNKNGNHYYTHRIVLPDGTALQFSTEKENAAQELSRGVTVSGSLADTTSAASIHSIRNSGENVNGEISLNSDSQGRALTQAQQEFFRDSKVVDRDGNLMVMYHGTKAENGDFTVFDYSKAVKRGSLGLKAMGKGNYFTSKPLNGTERFGSRVIEAYLNITNPFVYNGMNGDYVSLAEQVSKATGADTQGMNYDQLQSKMRELGYDGVIEYRRDGSLGVAVTFDSNQIKSVTNQSPTSDPDIRFSQDLAELEDLRKENKRLREQVDHWKGQLQKTTSENRTVRQKDVDRLAKDLVKSYESTLDTEQVSAELKKLGEFIVRNGDGKNELTWEAVHDSALKIGRELQFSYPNDTFSGNVRRNPAFFSPISTDFLLFFPFICIIIESRYIQILSLFGSRHI